MRLRNYQQELKPGDKFGRLQVVSKLPGKKYLCLCDCGNQHIVNSKWHLTSGNTKSCGCYQKDIVIKNCTKHGLSKHPLYKIWQNMLSRCNNPNATHYKYYGGKGVKVCSEWLTDFQSFYNWSITNGWRSGLTIDRIDSDCDYSPRNCRWVDYFTQNNNLSNNHLVTFNGKTQSIYAWARELSINPKTLGERLRRGWTVERAFTQVVQKREVVR